MNKEVVQKKIDIESVFRSKNPGMYRLLPGFVFSWLKRTIHEAEMNDFLSKNRDLRDVAFAQKILDYFGIAVEYQGLENIPRTGPVILVSNHPIGSVDALALITTVARRRTDIKFLVNDILMNLENLNGVFVPVNKHGKNPVVILREMETLYASDNLILIFPAGLVSRRKWGQVRDLEWKKSFVTKAKRTNRLIIPTYISGRNSGFFYNLGNFRKLLGIKANIEMLFLVNETFIQRNKTITLIFGEPIISARLSNRENDHILAEKIKQHVYRMGESGQPLPFVG